MAEKASKTATAGPLVIERTLHAPAALVWNALTVNDEMKQWYFKLPEFKAEVGFAFQFTVEHEGNRYCHLCVVKEVIPERKLAYSWRYEGQPGDSLVTFELFPEGDQTRLKLTHEGVETFPKTPAYARANFEAGWTSIVGTALKDFVERNAKGGSADTADREIVITRVVKAPRELVWDAWTKPEHVSRWWGPIGFTTTIHEMDVRPGGVWRQTMHGPDGVDYPNKSVFVEVVKPERIVFTHGGGKKGGPGAQFQSTWTFEAINGKTKVTIHMVFDSATERDLIAKEYGAIEGGHQTLGRLDEHLATM